MTLMTQSRLSATQLLDHLVGGGERIIWNRLMPCEKAPISGGFLPALLMYFCSGVDGRS
jgi:hypothetical protein